MPEMEIRVFGDPVLKEKSTDVKKIDEDLKGLIDNLTDTMYAAPGSGLAASQVGVTKRVFVFDVGEGLHVCINPKMTVIEEESTNEDFSEGCLSLNGINLIIKRCGKIGLDYTDEHGKKQHLEAEGLEARVIQHEMDHLDGLLILDRADREERAQALKILRSGLLSS